MLLIVPKRKRPKQLNNEYFSSSSKHRQTIKEQNWPNQDFLRFIPPNRLYFYFWQTFSTVQPFTYTDLIYVHKNTGDCVVFEESTLFEELMFFKRISFFPRIIDSPKANVTQKRLTLTASDVEKLHSLPPFVLSLDFVS